MTQTIDRTAMTREQRIETALNTLNNFYCREFLDAVTFEPIPYQDLGDRGPVQLAVKLRILDLLDELA